MDHKKLIGIGIGILFCLAIVGTASGRMFGYSPIVSPVAQNWKATTDGGGPSATTTNFIGSVLPDTNNLYSLGSAAKSWSNVYVSGTAYIGACSGAGCGLALPLSQSLLFSGTGNQYDIGSAVTSTRSIYSSSTIYGVGLAVTNATTSWLGFTTASGTTLNAISATFAAATGTWVGVSAGGVVNLVENTSINLPSNLSADGKYSGLTETATSGEALPFGTLAYFKGSDSKWWKADADATSTSGWVKLGVIVVAAGGADASVKVLLCGKVRADTAFPSFTVGVPVYASSTAGEVGITPPTATDSVTRVVGFSDSADELYFCPSQDYLTHT